MVETLALTETHDGVADRPVFFLPMPMEKTRTEDGRSWPEAMERGRVGDAAFAAAYARVTDRERAWIKTGVAALFAACGGPLPLRRREETLRGHDLCLASLDCPLDYALVVCGSGFASPARLAGAVLPALCARVPDVAAVRLGGAWPQPLLTTLELCGVESVFRLGVRAFAGLGPELSARGRGAVVCLDGVSLPSWPASAPRRIPARADGPLGVFSGPDAVFDWDALAFAHPDRSIRVHGAPCPDGKGFVAAAGGLAEAADLGYAAAFAGEADLEAALAVAPLALGPGREMFWLWPGITPETFRQKRFGASVHHVPAVW